MADEANTFIQGQEVTLSSGATDDEAFDLGFTKIPFCEWLHYLVA